MNDLTFRRDFDRCFLMRKAVEKNRWLQLLFQLAARWGVIPWEG